MSGLVKLRMCPWRRPFPLPGHYVMSRYGRTAYLVVEVKPSKTRKDAAVFHCERVRRADLPKYSVVRLFQWNSRSKTR